MIITEKIDGTNAQICIDSEELWLKSSKTNVTANTGGFLLWAGSRKRWITPEEDNYGFSRWVRDHAAELITLGPGRHFGEWWGEGIQRGYGLSEKKFSLFNVSRWSRPEDRPSCCDVVPVLYNGEFSSTQIEVAKEELLKTGSHAAPGYMNPEGVVVYLPKATLLFKAPYKEEPKGM